MTLTLVLVILTSLISYQAFQNPELLFKLKHTPAREVGAKEYYRMLSSGFVHGSWMHLIINMFVFYQFGEYVEYQFIFYFGEVMGRMNYLLLYLLAIIFGDIPTLIKHRNNPAFSSVGASGAVSAIVFVYVLFQPWSLLLLFFIIPIPAIIAAVLYLVYSSWASKRGQDMIDHDAHLYGALFGFLFAIVLRPAFFMEFINRLQTQFPF
jgi:membrane associated rhomboid family serine protease